MVTHTPSPLRVFTLTGALLALLSTTGCIAPTEVGVGNDPSSETSGMAEGIAFHVSPDEATLHVAISTLGLSCSNTGGGSTTTDSTCPVGWRVDFALPTAAQAVGVYDLTDGQFQSVGTVAAGASGGGNGCVGGGGGEIPGTKAEVLSIDATSLKVRLSGFDADGTLPVADGDYDVSRCP